MADIVMVGAGPQALALSCLLLQKRPLLQRRLRIVDPSGRWLSRWQRQMERYEIPWLRSPSPHHPHPSAHALRQFAQSRQRNRQLEGPYGLPHTDLFGDFCRQVISEYQLTDCVVAASVERIRLPKVGGSPMELALSDDTTMTTELARQRRACDGWSQRPANRPCSPESVRRAGGSPAHLPDRDQTVISSNQQRKTPGACWPAGPEVQSTATVPRRRAWSLRAQK